MPKQDFKYWEHTRIYNIYKNKSNKQFLHRNKIIFQNNLFKIESSFKNGMGWVFVELKARLPYIWHINIWYFQTLVNGITGSYK